MLILGKKQQVFDPTMSHLDPFCGREWVSQKLGRHPMVDPGAECLSFVPGVLASIALHAVGKPCGKLRAIGLLRALVFVFFRCS